MAPLRHKKDRGTSKLCFHHIDQSVTLNFELRYNERTLAEHSLSLNSGILKKLYLVEIFIENLNNYVQKFWLSNKMLN